MATFQAREKDSRSTPALVTAMDRLKTALGDVNQIAINFESKNREIRKDLFKSEDLLQHHLDHWRVVHNNYLKLNNPINETGVFVMNKLPILHDFVLQNNKKSASNIATQLSLEMSRVLNELVAKFQKLLSAFEFDQEHFKMLDKLQDFQLSYDKGELEYIVGVLKTAIPEPTTEVMPNCEQFSQLVDWKIKLLSEITTREVVKEILSKLSYELDILIGSMKGLVQTAEDVRQKTSEAFKRFDSIKAGIRDGKQKEALSLVDAALVEWKEIVEWFVSIQDPIQQEVEALLADAMIEEEVVTPRPRKDGS